MSDTRTWTFNDAQDYLNDTAPPGKSVYGLGRINHLLELLGHPEGNFPCVTIVGTNGKGSVIAFMDALLRSHGLKVACHIKPHLESVTERIRIDGVDSTERKFASSLGRVREAVDNGWSRDDRPTYFELIFAAFMVAADDATVDIALLETGLGGRLDAVNSVDADLVVLTSIGYDHTELLGNTLEEITKEKLAVVRDGSTLISQLNPPEVMQTVRNYTKDHGVRLIEADEMSMDGYDLGLPGPYRHLNAGLALQALNVLANDILPSMFPDGIGEDSVRMGLISARIPGRWETLRPYDRGPLWILDGAHNESGLVRILSEFTEQTSGSGTIIFGMKAAKSIESIIPALRGSGKRFIFVPVPDMECHDPSDLGRMLREGLDIKDKLSQIQIDTADSIGESMEIAARTTPDDSAILVTGSLYLVGAVRTELKEKI